MKHSTEITKLAAALVAAQGEMRPIVKDSTNPDYRSTYASLDAIVEAVRPILAKHELGIVQGTTTPESDANSKITGFSVETMLVHSSGEWLANAVVVPVLGRRKSKQDGGGFWEADAQSAGSAISYGRRYGICALLSLTTGEDDDGRAASKQRSGGERAGRDRAMADVGHTPASDIPASSTAQPARLDQTKVLPFGKSKGTPLADMKLDDLSKAVAWAREQKPEVYKGFIEAAELILDEKSAVGA